MSLFLDQDMAYLFGLIAGRGILKDSRGLKQIIISFPYKSLEATGVSTVFNQRDKILISLDPIINRIGELAGQTPQKVPAQKNIDIAIDLPRNNLLWRNIRALANSNDSFRNIEIHRKIFDSSEVIKKEFVRGFADVTAYARKGNVFIDGRHRIYFEIHNANWKMPVQLCTLLQSDPLNIPVQTIDWGHPNIRNGNAKEYNLGRKNAWAREHQLKVFAEAFQSIGFRITHKNAILKEMAEYNGTHYSNTKNKLCTPPKRIRQQKVEHPQENSDRLPSQLKDKHFDSYWQVCRDLGCVRYNIEK